MKKRLKNFTVIPAPMHVMKSANARMTGTCLLRKHRKRRTSGPPELALSDRVSPGSAADAADAGSEAGASVDAGDASGSRKTKSGRQVGRKKKETNNYHKLDLVRVPLVPNNCKSDG
mmetsp:Transcript_46991/g.105562  ORF Transcript_46991/g.105562 Transcript_46991/m.105562 type:complete len:117 (-) Transcript_46991:656-1006(-)